jgi:hypothetical protein
MVFEKPLEGALSLSSELCEGTAAQVHVSGFDG